MDPRILALATKRWGADAIYGVRLFTPGEPQIVACRAARYKMITLRTITADGTTNEQPELTEIPDQHVPGLVWLALLVNEPLLVEVRTANKHHRLLVTPDNDAVGEELRGRSAKEAAGFVLLHQVKVLTGLGSAKTQELLDKIDRSQALLIVMFAMRLVASSGNVAMARGQIEAILEARSQPGKLKDALGDFKDIFNLPLDRRFRVLRGAQITLRAIPTS